MPVEHLSRREAVLRCKRRYAEQCELFPTMRQDIPEALYVRVNASIVQRKALFSDYATEGYRTT